jgi:hypothetical protein
MEAETFGEVLASARKRSRGSNGGSLTQARLREMISEELDLQEFLTPATISNWERGISQPGVQDRDVLVALIAVLVRGGGLRSVKEANHLLQLGGYAPLSPIERQKAFGFVSETADVVPSNESAETEAREVPVPIAPSAVRPTSAWRRWIPLVIAPIVLLTIVGSAILLWLRQPESHRGPGFDPAIVDRPGGQLSLVQFDYTPANRGLRLYLCVEAKYYRLKSEELHPRPRMLVDRVYDVTDKCGYKYPVVELNVDDVEEVSIGVSDDKENFKTLRVYRITRTADGIEGGFVRDEAGQMAPRMSVTPQMSPSSR